MTTDHYAEAQRIVSWTHDRTGELPRHEELPITATVALTHAVLDIATTLRDRLPAMPGSIESEIDEQIAEHVYRVGDPDTTPDSGPWCEAASDYGDACTREPGYAPPHALGSGTSILAVWPSPAVCEAACPWEPQWRCSLDTGHGGEHAALGGDSSELLAHWPSAGPTVCPAVSEHGLPCTLTAGHDGRHATVSTGVRGLIAVWDGEPEPMTQAEWDALPVGTLVQATTEDGPTLILRGSGVQTWSHIGRPVECRLVGAYWSGQYDYLMDIRVLHRPEDQS